MKGIVEYIIENVVDIFEGSKGGFNVYFNSSEECIDACNNDENLNYAKSKYNLDDDKIDFLYSISNEEIPLTFDPYNKKIKLRRFFSDDEDIKSKLLDENIGEFIDNNNKFKITGAKSSLIIGDGGLSPKSKAGANTKPQELLLCDVIDNCGEVDYDSLLEKYKLSKEFRFSAEKQYEKFLNFIENKEKTKYKSFRADNKDKLINLLNNIYKNISIKYTVPKSYITPADIYAVKDYNDVYNTLNDLLVYINDNPDENKEDLFTKIKNNFYQLLTNKQLIPISLKKIVKSSSDHEVEILNTTKYNVNFTKDYNIWLTDRGLACKLKTEEGENIKFNFRSNQTNIYPYTFEFNTEKQGGADGKCKLFISNYMKNINLVFPTVKEFYTDYKNNDEFDANSFYKSHIEKAKNKFKDKFKEPNYNIDEIKNDDKLFYGLIQIMICLDLFCELRSEKEFLLFMESAYLASKKITNYSLPYILIK